MMVFLGMGLAFDALCVWLIASGVRYWPLIVQVGGVGAVWTILPLVFGLRDGERARVAGARSDLPSQPAGGDRA